MNADFEQIGTLKQSIINMVLELFLCEEFFLFNFIRNEPAIKKTFKCKFELDEYISRVYY